MKQIVAVVQPHRVENVLDVLGDVPLADCAVREVKGYGRQKSYLDEYHGSEYSLAFLPKVEVSVWVEDADATSVVRLLVAAARSGRIGDGKIFVLGSGKVVSG